MIDLNDPLAVNHVAQRNRRIRLAQSNRNHRRTRTLASDAMFLDCSQSSNRERPKVLEGVR